jgi:hypothetical protein
LSSRLLSKLEFQVMEALWSRSVVLCRASFDCDIHLLNGDRAVEFGHAAFQPRYSNLGKNSDGPIGLKEELEPIARFEQCRKGQPNDDQHLLYYFYGKR